MRLGVILPSFSLTPEPALDAAIAAEDAGLHGVFVYDHLWPLGEPGEPAISSYPLLGAVAQITENVRMGTLVARVGLVPNNVLLREMRTINNLSAGRLIAGLGTGDHKSAAENLAYGVEFAPSDVRREELVTVAEQLVREGIEVWIGGGSDVTNAIASRARATLNLWGASVEKVAAMHASSPVTWAGRFPDDPAVCITQLRALAAAGASWVVYSWPTSLQELVDAARSAEIQLGE